MTTPDLRPIGALTPEILSSSSHWCLLQDGNASVIQAECLDIDVVGLYAIVASDNSIVPKGTRIRVGFFSATCYPCTLQPDGLVVPEPWPVAEGEEEIEGFRGCVACSDGPEYEFSGAMAWVGVPFSETAPIPILEARPGFHPAPRKGKAGPVWVWEKNKC